MIIIFSSDAYENITMFGNVASALIKLMGYEVKAGVIKTENVGPALTRLKGAVDAAPPEAVDNRKDDNEDDTYERPVSLAHRALPLLEMLEASLKENCEVTWKVS